MTRLEQVRQDLRQTLSEADRALNAPLARGGAIRDEFERLVRKTRDEAIGAGDRQLEELVRELRAGMRDALLALEREQAFLRERLRSLLHATADRQQRADATSRPSIRRARQDAVRALIESPGRTGLEIYADLCEALEPHAVVISIATPDTVRQQARRLEALLADAGDAESDDRRRWESTLGELHTAPTTTLSSRDLEHRLATLVGACQEIEAYLARRRIQRHLEAERLRAKAMRCAADPSLGEDEREPLQAGLQFGRMGDGSLDDLRTRVDALERVIEDRTASARARLQAAGAAALKAGVAPERLAPAAHPEIVRLTGLDRIVAAATQFEVLTTLAEVEALVPRAAAAIASALHLPELHERVVALRVAVAGEPPDAVLARIEDLEASLPTARRQPAASAAAAPTLSAEDRQLLEQVHPLAARAWTRMTSLASVAPADEQLSLLEQVALEAGAIRDAAVHDGPRHERSDSPRRGPSL